MSVLFRLGDLSRCHFAESHLPCFIIIMYFASSGHIDLWQAIRHRGRNKRSNEFGNQLFFLRGRGYTDQIVYPLLVVTA